MTEITKISSKGQVVIPHHIRKELNLGIGSSIIITKMKKFILLKKMNIPDLEKEFNELTKFGTEFAKKKNIRAEEDVAKIIHKNRGL